jgi:hypothetical protein
MGALLLNIIFAKILGGYLIGITRKPYKNYFFYARAMCWVITLGGVRSRVFKRLPSSVPP